MPQLSPTVGFIIFFMVLLALLVLLISVNKTSIHPVTLDTKSSLKAGIYFFFRDGSLNA